MFYQHPPVGNPVVLACDGAPEFALEDIFTPYLPRFYASGTAALAAAMIACAKAKSVEHAEVIVPAYACPDLVSAAVFAGVKPVLVDLQENQIWLDLNQLEAKISERTAAIVAVDLFGMPERFTPLKVLAAKVGAILIEDSAQSFPIDGNHNDWKGDLVVLSFGRGKPVSLLGGGAVLYRDDALSSLLPESVDSLRRGKFNSSFDRLRILLYNLMISPNLYWLPQSLPFLHLGETRYHSLSAIESMEPDRLAMLPANITAYRSGGLHIQQQLAGLLVEFDGCIDCLINVPKNNGVIEKRRLLRYPILVDPATRDKLYLELAHHGLGPSKMYSAALPAIPGVEQYANIQDDFPQAESFAARVLTLPTHTGIGHKDLVKLRSVLSHHLN